MCFWQQIKLNSYFCFCYYYGFLKQIALRSFIKIQANKPIQDGGDADAPLWPNRLSGTD